MICPYLIQGTFCPFKTYEPYSAYRFAYSPIESDPPLTVTTTQITKPDDKINEYLQIPVFHGEINPQILENINNNVKNDIMEFKSQMEASAEDNAETLKKLGKKPNPYQISNTYSLTYNKNNILSLSLIYQTLISGKNSYIKTTFNYNLQTGESMSLRNLFKQGVDYIGTLNRKIREKLQVNYPSIVSQFKGIAEDQPYYLDNNTLVLFLRFNEIATTVSDIPVIRIPLPELSNILKPQLLRSNIDF
jgi:hypothetical protein